MLLAGALAATPALVPAGAPEKTLRVNAEYFGYNQELAQRPSYQLLRRRGPQRPGRPAARQPAAPARNSVKSAVAYAQPLGKGTLEAGLKTAFTVTDNDIRCKQDPADRPWAPTQANYVEALLQMNYPVLSSSGLPFANDDAGALDFLHEGVPVGELLG